MADWIIATIAWAWHLVSSLPLWFWMACLVIYALGKIHERLGEILNALEDDDEIEDPRFTESIQACQLDEYLEQRKKEAV